MANEALLSLPQVYLSILARNAENSWRATLFLARHRRTSRCGAEMLRTDGENKHVFQSGTTIPFDTRPEYEELVAKQGLLGRAQAYLSILARNVVK